MTNVIFQLTNETDKHQIPDLKPLCRVTIIRVMDVFFLFYNVKFNTKHPQKGILPCKSYNIVFQIGLIMVKNAIIPLPQLKSKDHTNIRYSLQFFIFFIYKNPIFYDIWLYIKKHNTLIVNTLYE
jgi:hypothetical protein